MKVTVIHHSADFDGLFCREIARKFLPEAQLIGWDWPWPPLEFPPEGLVYVLDLNPDCFAGALTLEQYKRLVWIDHHKSAIDKYDGPDDPEANLKSTPGIAGYRIDGVSACRVAWQWFLGQERWYLMPTKGQFVQRQVSEPLAVRLAGEYDIWDKRDPNAEVFQFGLRSRELMDRDWEALLADSVNAESVDLVDALLHDGRTLQRYQQRSDAGTVQERSFILEWEGLKFLALTTARCNSLTFMAMDMPETGHDALMGFYFNGKDWAVSMYHARHRTDLDLSQIAIRHGGGGHRGACGFRAAWLPFLHPQKTIEAAASPDLTEVEKHRGAILDGQFIVIGSGESYNTEIVDGKDLLRCVLEMLFGTEEDVKPEEKKSWEKALREPDNWCQDPDVGPIHFHELVGETDRLDIYLVTPPVYRKKEIAAAKQA